jgi:hypothetical protein
MDKSVIWPVVLMFLLPLALPTTALAQGAGTASFEGVLLDTAGQPAPGYPLAMKTPEGQQVVLQGTGDGGSFYLQGLPPGNYELLVLPKEGGKTPLTSTKMTLAAGQKQRLEIRLGSNTPAAQGTAQPTAGSAGTAEPAAGSAEAGVAGFGWRTILIAALGIGLIVALFFGRRSAQRVSS